MKKLILLVLVCLAAGALLRGPVGPGAAGATGEQVAVVGITGTVVVSTTGTIYEYTGRFGVETWSAIGSFGPLTGRPVGLRGEGTGMHLTYENGDVWYWSPAYGPVYVGNVFGSSGPVPVEPSTWGAIKAGK